MAYWLFEYFVLIKHIFKKNKKSSKHFQQLRYCVYLFFYEVRF